MCPFFSINRRTMGNLLAMATLVFSCSFFLIVKISGFSIFFQNFQNKEHETQQVAKHCFKHSMKITNQFFHLKMFSLNWPKCVYTFLKNTPYKLQNIERTCVLTTSEAFLHMIKADLDFSLFYELFRRCYRVAVFLLYFTQGLFLLVWL